MNSRGTLAYLAIAAVLVGASAVATPAAAAPAPPSYRYIDLGVLGKPSTGEDAQAMAYGVNNARTVVGVSTIAGIYNFHGFVWHDGVLTDLGTLAPGPYAASDATAVSDQGVVVGSTHVNTTEPGHAFRYVNGVLTDLGTGAAAGSGSSALDVNDGGTVVGRRITQQGAPDDGAVWRDGKIIVLGTLGGQAGPWAPTASPTP
jgi:probable HAF family extracellular repeat protein